MMEKHLDKIALLYLVLLSGFYIYANWNGLGFTPDSYYYLESAKLFRATFSFEGMQINNYFPFQSFLIILLAGLGDKNIIHVFYVHLFALLGSFWLMFYISKKLIHQPTFVFYFITVLLLSTSIIMVHTFLWTEPLFILSLSLMWLQLNSYYSKPSYKKIIGILLVGILVCLQRKAGLLIVLGTGIGLILFKLPKQSKATNIVVTIIWILGIAYLYGFLGGINVIGERPILENSWNQFIGYLDALSGWILPLPFPFGIRLIVLLFILGLIFHQVFITDKTSNILKSFVVIIIVYVVVRFFYYRPDSSEMDRYLAPIYPLFFILLFSVLESITQSKSVQFKKITHIIIIVWLLYPAIRIAKNAYQWHQRKPVTHIRLH